MSKLTHLDETGAARMVDITAKAASEREARAQAVVHMQPATLEMITSGGGKKGDVFAAARIAGIQAAKRTSELIPLCHPLLLTGIEVQLEADAAASCACIETRCRLRGRTGVEMEALTAAAVAALTIYDMCKALDRGMEIGEIRLLQKRGGASGDWTAEQSGGKGP